jgi:predicted amidophosphoribosyltransferase
LSVDALARLCAGCALPLQHVDVQHLDDKTETRCPRCRRVPLAFSSAEAAYAYGAALADALVRLKQGRRRDLVPGLARLLAPLLFRVLARQPALEAILPVPLHPQRLRQREFNQSLELARSSLRLVERETRRIVAVRDGDPSPAWPLPPILRTALARTRNTRSLGRLGPADRLKEVAGAFAVRTPSAVRGKRVLVLDDVMTTGATFHACAEALLEAGAAEVRVVALARAVI